MRLVQEKQNRLLNEFLIHVMVLKTIYNYRLSKSQCSHTHCYTVHCTKPFILQSLRNQCIVPEMQSVIKMAVNHISTDYLNSMIVPVIQLVAHTHRFLEFQIGHSARDDVGDTHIFLELWIDSARAGVGPILSPGV